MILLQRLQLVAVIIIVTMILSNFSAVAVNIPLAQMGVPRDDLWGPLPRDVVDELRLLLDADPAEVDALLASDDPREVGLGLFVLEQNADLERLITLVDLVDDERPTLPYPGGTVTNETFIRQEQTIGEYLSHIYAMWFDIPADKVAERKDEIRNMGDPWARPFPWLQKYSRARRSMLSRGDDIQAHNLRMAAVKQEIAALAPEIRWVVVTVGRGRGYYSPDEARIAMMALDPAVQDAIMAGDPLAPRQMQVGWEMYEKDLAAKAREILKGP